MSEIPETVVAFIRKYIDSVEQLEILLLLRRNAETEWTATEVSREISSNAEAVAVRMAEFASEGILLPKRLANESKYRYQPQDPEVDATIRQVAKAYGTYPVRIITLIVSKPIDKIKTFADAYKPKKEEDK
jgi:hypothetical protein